MKKMFSNTMVPAKRKPGKAPTITKTPQQKVGAPVPDETPIKTPRASGSNPKKRAT
jgi:hypothetical protein